MLSFDEALAHILEAVTVADTETLPLDTGPGRVLAAPVTAGHNQPPFDGSAMDGYAVRAADISPGAAYDVIGESQAGAAFDGDVPPGKVVRIFTGAPLPAGTDSVIIQENATRDGDTVRFTQGAEPGRHVRRTGQDFSRGDTLFEPGHRIDAAAIALLAAANVPEVRVYKRPDVALLSTGDELVPVGADLAPGRIVGSNTHALKALLTPDAGTVTDLGNAPDTEDGLKRIFEQALAGDAQFIVSTGGASVGDHDLVQPVLKSLGVDVGFWKIAMRPGKPLMFGTGQSKLILALPGNPVSAFVTAALLVLPALQKAGGRPAPGLPRLTLPLAAALPANGPRRHFIRAALADHRGMTAALPFGQTDSAHLTSLAQADLLIVHEEDGGAKQAGDLVECVLLPGKI